MKANEVRIGNYVLIPHNKSNKEKGFYEGTIIKIGDFGTYVKVEDYQPIPLTGDILLEFGFETDSVIFWNGLLSIGDFKDGFYYLPTSTITLRRGIEIKYVHQLQNLYSALTGEELTYGDNNEQQ